MQRKIPIFYSAILLTGVNLLLRLVGTSFQVYISGRIGAAGVGLLQLVMSVGAMAMTVGMAGIRTGAMYLTRNITVKGFPLLGLTMPALFNALIIGWELELYIGGGFWLNALYVAIGEAAVLLTLGSALYYTLQKTALRKYL